MTSGPTLPPFDHHAPEHMSVWIAQTDAMRAEGPVGWTPANGGHWVVVGHAEVKRAALDWQTFSSWHDITGECPMARGIGLPPLAFPLILSESDPPLSTERRKLELPFFRAAEMQRWTPVVQTHVDEHLLRIGERGAADLFLEYAMPVVAKTTMELVGVGLDRWEEFTLSAHHGAQGTAPDPQAELDRVHGMLADLARTTARSATRHRVGTRTGPSSRPAAHRRRSREHAVGARVRRIRHDGGPRDERADLAR